MVVFLVNGVGLVVLESIVHPAEIPLVIETEPAVFHGVRYLGEIGGIFRDHHRARVLRVDFGIETTNEFGRSSVLATGFIAVPVYDVAYCVTANAVKMEIREEVIHRGHEEAANGILPKVELGGPPRRDFVLALIFVEARSVETAQSEGVRRKVDGGEIEDDPKTRAVHAIDEGHKLLGIAVARIDGIETGRLIAPRSVEGVLRDRHDLNVGESGFLQVGD